MENSIRPLALGRKNYLFCGNDDAAENAAVIYSLMGCCKANEVNFREWFVYVLENIHEYDNDYSKDLAELLPQNWRRTNSQNIQSKEDRKNTGFTECLHINYPFHFSSLSINSIKVLLCSLVRNTVESFFNQF